MHAKKREMSYTIDLNRLQSGSMSYNYEIGDDFFAAIDNSLICRGNLSAEVKIRKGAGETFHLSMYIKGNVAMPCDRCLDDVEIPVEVSETVNVKMGSEAEETETCIVVAESHPVLDVQPLLYDYIAVSVPIQHVHEEGKCNEAMMNELKNYLVQDTDIED